MRVHMDCGGCGSKVKTTLQKLKGVDEVDIDMGMLKVTVTGWADQKKVLKTVRKTGRYHKQGYDSNDPAYYRPPAHSTIFCHQTGSAFSDENPHACSIM
ncbi:hypothetical protein PTKIN_Ptkin03bG0053600 [Pterospermum kingtungense]